MRKMGSLPQVSNASIIFPGTDIVVYGDYVEIPVSNLFNHHELLQDREFLGLLTEKRWAQSDGINTNLKFLATSVSLVEMVEAELQ